nr:Death on curing protein, Doc toxin [uncultured bacterium]
MKLVWTRPAHADRQAIRKYIVQHAPAAALALDELFSEQADLLIDHPGLGRTGRVAGTRELVAHRNYILIYDTTGDVVRVLRVLHAARQWPPHDTMTELLAGAEDVYPQPPVHPSTRLAGWLNGFDVREQVDQPAAVLTLLAASTSVASY